MNIGWLILREILHRKLNFGLGLLSIVIAAGALAGAVTLLRKHDLQTSQILDEMEAESTADMARLEDDMRKAMKNLGFNILILPKDQNMSDLYDQDFASKYMPEEYVHQLAASRIVIAHLLPQLTQKLEWTERKRTILLTGVRGEVGDTRTPILEPVPAGKIVLGYEIHHSLALSEGEKIVLLGREFTIHKCHPARGSKDDITAWIHLKAAQELLAKPGLINGIQGLECVCLAGRLGTIRPQIEALLPNTQVIGLTKEAFVRAEAREAAEVTAIKNIADAKRERARLHDEKEALAGVLVPLAIVACAAWIGLLIFQNTRERRPEIGILRTLGVGAFQIIFLFLAKAVLMGVLGAGAGYVLGLVVGISWGGSVNMLEVIHFFDLGLLLIILVSAPLLAALASWIPAMLAAQQDPATVLRET